MPTCPQCRKEAAAAKENKYFPFCCDRCQKLDLGAWANEEYTIAATEDPSENREESLTE